MRRWPDDIETLLRNPRVLNLRDAGGSRTHSNAALQAAAVPSGSSVKRPRQESNLVLDLRRVACSSGTPRGRKSLSSPPRS